METAREYRVCFEEIQPIVVVKQGSRQEFTAAHIPVDQEAKRGGGMLVVLLGLWSAFA